MFELDPPNRTSKMFMTMKRRFSMELNPSLKVRTRGANDVTSCPKLKAEEWKLDGAGAHGWGTGYFP